MGSLWFRLPRLEHRSMLIDCYFVCPFFFYLPQQIVNSGIFFPRGNIDDALEKLQV